MNEDPQNPGYGTDGHPLVKGTVNAVMVPIKPKPNTGESKTFAVGAALDADGNPIDQTELLKLIAAEGATP